MSHMTLLCAFVIIWYLFIKLLRFKALIHTKSYHFYITWCVQNRIVIKCYFLELYTKHSVEHFHKTSLSCHEKALWDENQVSIRFLLKYMKSNFWFHRHEDLHLKVRWGYPPFTDTSLWMLYLDKNETFVIVWRVKLVAIGNQIGSSSQYWTHRK